MLLLATQLGVERGLEFVVETSDFHVGAEHGASPGRGQAGILPQTLSANSFTTRLQALATLRRL